MAGREPTVIKTALRVVMTFGCSVVKNSRALAAFRSQVGTFVTVVTAEKRWDGISMPDVTRERHEEGKTYYRQAFDWG